MFKSFPSTNFPSRELVLFSHTQGHVITFAIMNAFYCKKIRYYILQLCRYKDKYSLDWIIICLLICFLLKKIYCGLLVLRVQCLMEKSALVMLQMRGQAGDKRRGLIPSVYMCKR